MIGATHGIWVTYPEEGRVALGGGITLGGGGFGVSPTVA
jgi:hypothetical protein